MVKMRRLCRNHEFVLVININLAFNLFVFIAGSNRTTKKRWNKIPKKKMENGKCLAHILCIAAEYKTHFHGFNIFVRYAYLYIHTYTASLYI